MALQRVRRTFVWTVLVLYLAAIAAALVLVWTSASREWYIDIGGADVTLSMNLSETARLAATVLLGVLALVGALALLLDSIASRREAELRAMSGRLGGEPRRRAAGGPPVTPPYARPQESPPGGFDAVVVGDQGTQRLEGSLPREQAAPPPAVNPAMAAAAPHGESETTSRARRIDTPGT
jgi:hypothetical protein